MGETVAALLGERSLQDLCKLQLNNPITGPVLRAVEKDTRLKLGTIACGGPEIRRLTQHWDRLLMEEGLLKRKYENVKGQGLWTQLVVLCALCKEIMQ